MEKLTHERSLTFRRWGSGLSWGLYFAGYNRAKGLFAKTLHGDSLATDKLGSVEHLCAGVATGAAIMAITNPIWVVKTRMCSEVHTQTDALFSLPLNLFILSLAYILD